jgi:hypothetical protein
MSPNRVSSTTGFAALHLSPALVAAVTALGYEEPTPVLRNRFALVSLVEVPQERADEIVAAMKAATLRGQKVRVRRDRDSR